MAIYHSDYRGLFMNVYEQVEKNIDELVDNNVRVVSRR